MSRTAIADAAIARGEGPIWLCTLTLPDGRSIRVATEPVHVEPSYLGTDGPYSYDPFLAGVSDFAEELDYFGLEGSASLTQASVDIITTEDLASLQGDWYAVTASVLELALIWPGEAWEDRHVILGGGRIQSVEFGLVGEPTTFSVESGPVPTSANIGDDELDLGTDWPDTLSDTAAASMTSVVGSKYQWVYGDPESVPAYKVGNVGGANRLILAGHKFPRSGASYQVLVTEYNDDIPGTATAYTLTNGTLPTSTTEPYAYTTHATNFASADGSYTYSARYGGIGSALNPTVPALGAGEVLRKLLFDTGLPVDWRRMAPCLEQLGGWRVGFYLDSETSAIDVIREHLTPILPIIEVNSGDGLWFAFGAPERAPVEATLTLGQELIGRVSRMSTTDLESVRNSFTLNFWLDAATGEHLETATLGPDDSALCYLSQQLYGVREDDVQESSCIWDLVTARRVLAHRAARFALPRRIIEYQASPDAYWLEAGMVVLVTDPDYGIDEHRAVVTAIDRGATPAILRLELVDRTATSRD